MIDKFMLALIVLVAAFFVGYGYRQGEIDVLKNKIEAANVQAKTNERIWNDKAKDAEQHYEGDVGRLRDALNRMHAKSGICPTTTARSAEVRDATASKSSSGGRTIEVDVEGCLETTLQVMKTQQWVREVGFPIQK